MKRLVSSIVLAVILVAILFVSIDDSSSNVAHRLRAATIDIHNDLMTRTMGADLFVYGLQHSPQIHIQQSQIALSKTSAGELPWNRTSDYMLGTVAVAIILPQCTSSISCTELWTLDEIMQVRTEVESGLNWWEQKATEAGVAVSFKIVPGHPITIPVAQEAIRHPGGNSNAMCGNEGIWIDPIMVNLGFNNYPSADNQYLHEVRDYDNYLRDAYNTDWAFVVFVVDASNDSVSDPDDGDAGKGLFKLTTCGGTVEPFGVSGYGWLAGPHMAMNNINNGYGAHFMDGIAAMEIAHIFGAPDEWRGYRACMPPGEGPSCDYPWGYLHIPNGNCNYLNDPNTQTCMLNDNLSLLRHPEDYGTGVIHNTVNTYTQGHLGWWDTDEDSWADPIDTTAIITLCETFSDPSLTTTPVFSGIVQDIPFPTTNYTYYVDITINKVIAQYRIDDGSWHTAIPADGTFDSFYETFRFTPLLCQNRMYLIEVRGVNTVGNTSSIVTTTLTISSTIPCQNIYLPILLKNFLP